MNILRALGLLAVALLAIALLMALESRVSQDRSSGVPTGTMEPYGP